jgi:hypothetical protein
MSSTVASPLRTDFERRPARSSASTSAPEIIRVLGSIMAVVLVAYLIIGLAMPVLPLYVHQELGLSTFMVGVAAGAEFAAALVSRFWSAALRRHARRQACDRHRVSDGRRSGLLYLVSIRFARSPVAAIAIVLVGRVFLGGCESFVITVIIHRVAREMDALGLVRRPTSVPADVARSTAGSSCAASAPPPRYQRGRIATIWLAMGATRCRLCSEVEAPTPVPPRSAHGPPSWRAVDRRSTTSDPIRPGVSQSRREWRHSTPRRSGSRRSTREPVQRLAE